MKIFFIIAVCMLISKVQAQSSLFREGAKALIEARDSISFIDDESITVGEYDFMSQGMDRLNSLCLSELKASSRNHPDVLQSSKTLTTLAQLATKAWRGSQYSDKKRWSGLAKNFRRAFERSTSKFNYTKQVSFRLELMNDARKSFYYDKRAGVSELNLYKGKKPSGLTKKEKEELPDPIPVPYMTEEELLKQFIVEISRQKIGTDLKRGKYAYVGLQIQLDENTLNKNKIPTARVVLVLGARRLRDIRLKKRYYVKGE